MFILQAAPEIAPFAKTGGLGDVAGGIVRPIAAQDHRIAAIMPYYRAVREKKFALKRACEVSIRIGEKTRVGVIWKGVFPGTEIPAYFVEENELFDRAGLYGTGRGDYPDNAERFVFFCRAVLEGIEALDLPVDVIHAHDWQTALLPVYLKTLYAKRPALSRIQSLLTIHNVSYQGVFWHWDMALTGLDWTLFNWKQLEFWGKLNLLKGGIVFADHLTTVSPQYAKEIQTAEFGCALEGVLRDRAADLTGIMNGIDTEEWNPESDRLIPARFSPSNLAGKAACKAALRKKMGLPESPAPLFGIVSRLVEQKGIDLVVGAMHDLAAMEVQVAILGSGDDRIQQAVVDAGRRFPRNVAVKIGFDEQLAHEIVAGSDGTLMPSRYEPCGLNQLYSLRYGTIPVVRRTGGLADTVKDGVNGFTFELATADGLVAAVKKSVAAWRQPQVWSAMMQAGMKQDWSWSRSALEYAALYARLAAKVKK